MKLPYKKLKILPELQSETFTEVLEKKMHKINLFKILSSLFADDMMLYIENPKNATRNLLELIN